MPRRITTVEQLNECIDAGQTGFFIALMNGGLRASYDILRRGDRYHIESMVCTNNIEVSSQGLFDDRLTPIGKAMNCGALFSDTPEVKQP